MRDFVRVHFFAGIAGWDLALRLGGWPNESPVWTGSCPCQPFSSSGKQGGEADERHLWPAFWRLISECRPPVVFGEQVASPLGRAWLAAVRVDCEILGYRVGAADIPAGAVGAPHLRNRLWWCAMADPSDQLRAAHEREVEEPEPTRCGEAGPVGDSGRPRLEGHAGHGDGRDEPGRIPAQAPRSASEAGSHRPVADAESRTPWDPRQPWTSATPIECTDGKKRLVEPGVCPLAHGVPGRVGRLRAYGNAIVPQVGSEFVRAMMEAMP